MTTLHLSEVQIQEYAIDSRNCGEEVHSHMISCAACQARTAQYKAMFGEMQLAPKPSFDFDLAGLVAEQLPQVRPKRSGWQLPLAAFTALAGLLVPVLLYWRQLMELVNGAPGIWLLLMGLSTLVIILFQGQELIRNYKRQMDTLQFN
jgi:anti-sigma factor RsiW